MKNFVDLPITEMVNAIRAGDRVMLSRAITLTESTHPEHRARALELLAACYPFSGNSMRIGITGAPGAGKSTFIEAFGMLVLQHGRKLGVLVVDPSSRVSKGSILGDKTRMQQLTRAHDVFIRPTASGTQMGGVAAATRECIILLEAAGYDTILIETVGVGQSETAVFDITDMFLLLLIPGAGDELQGIKRGIMEMADAILINKADGDLIDRARIAKAEVERAIHLFQPKASGYATWVQLVSSAEGSGLADVWENTKAYFEHMQQHGHLTARRQAQREKWFDEALHDGLIRFLQSEPRYGAILTQSAQEVASGELLPPLAVAKLMAKLLPS